MKNLLIIFLFLFPLTTYPCTVFAVKNENSVLVGRNFDWNRAAGKIWFVPKIRNNNGYVIFEQLGNKRPYEGNKGLFVAFAMVSHKKLKFSLFKKKISSPGLIKKILEKCSNVEESIRLIPKYQIVWGQVFGYPQNHYLIADKTGDFVIVEYLEKGITFIRPQKRFCIITNFYVSEGNRYSCKRYRKVENELFSIKEVTGDRIKKILGKVANPFTIWSNVYDLKKGIVYVRYNLELLKILNNPAIYTSDEPFLTYLNSYENIKYDFTKTISFELSEELLKKSYFYKLEEIFTK
jgi:penicillin V acylase-like amidase (Ntn superfamily)